MCFGVSLGNGAHRVARSLSRAAWWSRSAAKEGPPAGFLACRLTDNIGPTQDRLLICCKGFCTLARYYRNETIPLSDIAIAELCEDYNRVAAACGGHAGLLSGITGTLALRPVLMRTHDCAHTRMGLLGLRIAMLESSTVYQQCPDVGCHTNTDSTPYKHSLRTQLQANGKCLVCWSNEHGINNSTSELATFQCDACNACCASG